MLFRTHFTIALFFGIFLSRFFNNKILFVVLVVLFGLLADLDTPFSKIGRRKCLRPIQWLAGHRKIFHSFFLVGLFSAILFLFSEFLMCCCLIGYGSHLIADAFTIQGIQPLYPLEYRIKGFIKTGGFGELVFFVVTLFGIFLLLF